MSESASENQNSSSDRPQQHRVVQDPAALVAQDDVLRVHRLDAGGVAGDDVVGEPFRVRPPVTRICRSTATFHIVTCFVSASYSAAAPPSSGRT